MSWLLVYLQAVVVLRVAQLLLGALAREQPELLELLAAGRCRR